MKLNGFLGPSYNPRSTNMDSQRSINLYPEQDELGTGKEGQQFWLSSVPGLTLLHSLPQGPLRCLYYTANGFIYCVSGSGLYQLMTTDGVTFTHLLLATMSTSTGNCYIQDGVPNMYLGIANTGLINQVVVVDGSPYAYCWEEGTTIVYSVNSSNGYFVSNFVSFQDGFFLFSEPGQISAYYASDPLNISDLDIINVNIQSDNVTRVISDHDIVWIFGSRTTSVWQNTGGSTATSNVFQQIPGAVSEGGCNAPNTINKCYGQLLWCANDDRGYGAVYMANGYRGQRVSNHAVEAWLQSFPDISGATAWNHQVNGHQFYCLNVPGATSTWCFDLITQEWCERQYFDDGQYERDLVSCHCGVYQSGVGALSLCGDYRNGNIYKLDSTSSMHNGVPVHRVRVSPHSSDSLKRLFYSQLHIDVLTGQGADGNGILVQSGLQQIATPLTATNVLMQSLGNNQYQLLANDGTVVTSPTSGVVVSATVPLQPGPEYGQNWSGSYSLGANGVVTINKVYLALEQIVIAHGNGVQSQFQTPNLVNKTVVGSFPIIAVTDWRGTNDWIQYPQTFTNLCAASSDFNYAGIWFLGGANATPNTLWVAPDGISVTTLLTEDTSTGIHSLNMPYRSADGSVYAFSVYAKQISGSNAKRWVTLQVGASTPTIATFDLTLGTITENIGTGYADIILVSPGVYRLSIGCSEAYSLTTHANIGLSNTATPGAIASYAGDGLSYVGIWGCQLSNYSDLTPLVSTSGTVGYDYYTYDPILGYVLFNVAPLSGSSITISGLYNDSAILPTEYMASFTYNEYLPNMVPISTDPQLTLSWSDDHGYTFKPERSVSMGKVGDRYRRCIWRRLGMSRDRVFKVICTDPVPFQLIGAEVEVTEQQG